MALLGAVALSPVAYAQLAPAATAPSALGPALTPPTVAVVDVQRVVRESLAGKSIQGQLEAEGRKFRDQVTHLQDEIKIKENNLRLQKSVAAPDAWNEQAQALQRQEADAQRFVQERRDVLAKSEGDSENVVGDNMRDIVQQLAAERHFGIVLRKELVLSIADKNMDITDDVIQRLNGKLPSVTVNVPKTGETQTPAETPTATASGKSKK
jgi:Skp family chaperone for outer membrane proteins